MHRVIALAFGFMTVACSVHVGSAPRPVGAAPRPAVATATPTPTTPRIKAMGRTHPKPGVARPAPAADSSVAQLCVDEINRYRATLGLAPLERATDREACADGQIADDAESGHWHGRFGACGESAQNECMTSTAPRADMIKGCLKGLWSEGPGGGHYENMRSATAKRVWCGFTTKANGDVWSVQDFR